MSAGRVSVVTQAQQGNPDEQQQGVEADESYFGGVRKGKRGLGAAGKIAVFGL